MNCHPYCISSKPCHSCPESEGVECAYCGAWTDTDALVIQDNEAFCSQAHAQRFWGEVTAAQADDPIEALQA